MEVELRARIDNIAAMRKQLTRMGARFEKRARQQDDRYFILKGKEDEPVRPGDPLFRIREEGKTVKMNVKLLTERPGIWEEHEVKVDDKAALEAIMRAAGLVEAFTLTKTRLEGKRRKVRLFLDDIQVLGTYLEAELIVPPKDAAAAQEELRQLFKELAISDADIEPRGYARILREQMGTKYENSRKAGEETATLVGDESLPERAEELAQEFDTEEIIEIVDQKPKG